MRDKVDPGLEISPQNVSLNTPTTSAPRFRSDISAAISVFLISVPLCLGIALASGAPLLSGVIAGVVGGMLVAPLSGSHLSISGPAAGLAILSAESIQQLGSFENFLIAVSLAGLLQLFLAFFRLGVAAYYVPTSVINGLVAGIGIVLILKQLPHALGHDSDFAGDEEFSQPLDGENTLTAIVHAAQSINLEAALIATISLAVLVMWDRVAVIPLWFRQIVPAPLVAIISGVFVTLISESSGGVSGAELSVVHYVQIPAFASASEFFAAIPFPNFSALGDLKVWKVAGIVAVIASIESLLALEAVAKLDPLRRLVLPNRELFAQGVGNMTSGFVGGLPLATVIVRSSANVHAGGQSRLSGVLSGIFILCAVVIAPEMLSRIPLPSLAAILIYLGFKLAHPSLFKRVASEGYTQLLPFLLTILGILFTNLLLGVVLGTIFGLYFVVKTNHHDAITLVHDDLDYLVRFNKDLSFLNKVELMRALEQIPDRANVYFDGTRAMFIDRDICGIVEDFTEQAAHRGISISEKNMRSKILPFFSETKATQ